MAEFIRKPLSGRADGVFAVPPWVPPVGSRGKRGRPLLGGIEAPRFGRRPNELFFFLVRRLHLGPFSCPRGGSGPFPCANDCCYIVEWFSGQGQNFFPIFRPTSFSESEPFFPPLGSRAGNRFPPVRGKAGNILEFLFFFALLCCSARAAPRV